MSDKLREYMLHVPEDFAVRSIERTSLNGTDFIGRNAFHSPLEGFLLARCAYEAKDYIEIGTLFGYSACIAGLTCKGLVHVIDPLIGYYEEGEPDAQTNTIASVEILKENWTRVGLPLERLIIHQQYHPPWPDALKDARFDVAFIDGDHSYEGTLTDWMELKDRVNMYMIFHDTNYEDIQKVIKIAVDDPDWTFYDQVARMLVVRRYSHGGPVSVKDSFGLAWRNSHEPKTKVDHKGR